MNGQAGKDLLNRGIATIRREPLFQFLLIGLGIFLLYAVVGEDRSASETTLIEVDQESLLQFMQLRESRFGKDARQRLETMPPGQVARLVDQYVSEEAKYREAVALGLGEDDYLIRRRLVQSLEFLLRNMPQSAPAGQDQLRAYYSEHRDRYASAARITFTHIFFSKDQHGWRAAGQKAQDLLEKPGGGVEDRQGQWPGDRFAYGLNYAERDRDLVASHFGQAMAENLFAAKADPTRWQGPFRSESGVHLVRIDKLEAGAVLPFDMVQEDVARDYAESLKARFEQAASADLVESYEVSISPAVRRLMREGSTAK